MKLIFLDVDGVLNTLEDDFPDRGYRLRPALVRLVDWIAERAEAQIILSSDWRLFYGLDGCRSILGEYGLRAPILDGTPDLRESHLDENDANYLRAYAQVRRVEVERTLVNRPAERFVVLDDLAVFPADHPSMVLTSPYRGLAISGAERAMVALGAGDLDLDLMPDDLRASVGSAISID